ncbi:MAG: SDR family NAD(P)-dependent oxidoreductase, partial [Methylocapsa sp.]|nr:SDR family NAD(P)-dependent oxidoreductase [Methylocapsa sp.]
MPAKSLLITGASSGIGRALAFAYAGPGISLALMGRDPGRLEEAASAARARGAEVLTTPIDVRNQSAMAEWIADLDHRLCFDLAIANAGITTGLAAREFAEDPA